MIDENKTLELFGYTSDSLSHGSNKKIVAICDKCGKERIIIFQLYRDLCIGCAHIGKKPMLGKKHTLETKQKMSIAHSGNKHHFYGKKHSEEHKEKMSKSQLGKKHSDESKRKMSEARKGKNNLQWQGGISFEPYCINFNNEIKEQVREEFNRKCFLCGKDESKCKTKLSVHHVDHNKGQGCNSDWKLVPLCDSCHPRTSGKYVRDYYEDLISRLLYIRELIFKYNSKIDYKSM